MVHRIFLQFYMKLEGLKGLDLMNTKLSKKILILQKKLKHLSEKSLLAFAKKNNPLICLLIP